MEPTRLPAEITESSLSKGQVRLRQRVADLIVEGKTISEIATALSRGDKHKAYNWRQKLRRWAATDKVFVGLLHEAANANLQVGLAPASAGLTRRAARGRVGEVKLLMEAAGFHNSKQTHEHTGEVKISITMPRPTPVANLEEGGIVDADVVED